MNSRPPDVLAGVILVLVAAAGGVIAFDAGAEHHRDERAREFQRLVGGLGLGPATDVSGCGVGFDPRVCPACPQDLGPIPGGAAFCPYHGCSVLTYPCLGWGTGTDPADHAAPP